MSAKKASGEGPRKAEWPTVHVITDLEQVKAMAMPLRLRILEPLCVEPRTTKQIAEILGEKPTKLYHHVEALEKVGLIQLDSTRQKRGTLEKYYRAIARSFRADNDLFSLAEPKAGEEESWQTVATSVLEMAVGEIRQVDTSRARNPLSRQEALFAGIRARLPKSRLEELRRKLEGWVAELQELDLEAEDDGTDYRAVIAFYPLEIDEPADAAE